MGESEQQLPRLCIKEDSRPGLPFALVLSAAVLVIDSAWFNRIGSGFKETKHTSFKWRDADAKKNIYLAKRQNNDCTISIFS